MPAQLWDTVWLIGKRERGRSYRVGEREREKEGGGGRQRDRQRAREEVKGEREERRVKHKSNDFILFYFILLF